MSGKSLTFYNGATFNSITGNRTWLFDGSGETSVSGDITTTSANFGVIVSKTGSGILNWGAGAGSNYNKSGAALDIDNGILRAAASNVIPALAGYGGVNLTPELAASDVATFDLNGTTQIINGLTASSDGTAIIDNSSASAASLTFGANNSAVSFGAGAGTYSVTESGGGALTLIKAGTANGTIAAGVTLAYTGATNVEGGTLTISSAVGATTSLNVTNGSTLALVGGMTTPSAVTSVFVDNLSTLNLLDSAGNKLTSLTTLTLGSAAGTNSFLNLNVGDVTAGDMLNTDTLTVLTGGTLNFTAGNQVTFNLVDAGLNGLQQYNLISAVDGGLITGALGSGDWLLGGTPGGFSSITLTKTDTLIYITTGTLITGTSYWRRSDRQHLECQRQQLVHRQGRHHPRHLRPRRRHRCGLPLGRGGPCCASSPPWSRSSRSTP